MAFTDFIVRYDSRKDTMEDISERILYSLIVKRLKHKKPAVLFISADSGEGKSYTSIAFQDILLKTQGLDLKDYFLDINVFTPLEYPKKLDALLFSKKLKKVNFICMHEAREIIKAKNWRTFLAQSISDVNAMSRQIKPLGIIIISQFIRDITTDIRYTLNYYIKVRRPRGKPARAYINVMWKDDRDLEKPKLRKRKISGYLVNEKGRYQRYIPSYVEIRHPRKELTKLFEKADGESKKLIIRRKLNKLIEEMRADIGEEGDKVKTILKWYLQNDEQLPLIGRRYKDKFRINKEFQEMHDLSDVERKTFETKLQEALKEKGVVKKKEDVEGWEHE